MGGHDAFPRDAEGRISGPFLAFSEWSVSALRDGLPRLQ